MSESFDEWYKDQKEFQKEWAEQELGIVRCKDCKYMHHELDGSCFCEAWDDMPTQEDDFCSRGEER